MFLSGEIHLAPIGALSFASADYYFSIQYFFLKLYSILQDQVLLTGYPDTSEIIKC